ncbi:SH3 domain-containing protein [Synechocystis sp. LKSZ1]|uniref:SH3 domain-containing protein n=1 Tax=Synechocystis sp. LKSZ1 TaxID=3144951 RepID=UPI00336BDCF9
MLRYILAVPIFGSLLAAPALAQSTAVVIAPPSNVRNTPNGAIICTLSRRISITVYQKEGLWYYTDACGGGYIHQSQIRFQGAAATGNRARVTGIRQGQLALRASPNGRAIAGLNNGNVVQILEQQGNWAYVRVVQGPNRRVTGREGWVNSYYLALF